MNNNIRIPMPRVNEPNLLLGLCVLVLLLTSTAMSCAASESLPRFSPAQLGLDAEHLQRIKAIVEQDIEKQRLPGCVVMIGRKGGIAFAEAYGNRQLQPSVEAMTLDTVFDLASLTKPIATASSIMLLVERGIVRLREPVSKYLPEFAKNGKGKITIEQLLTHQGGLIPDNALSDYQEGVEKAWQNIWDLKPTDALGKKFVYTDVGFIVLGEVVHRMTGQTVAEFAFENLYRPLGMLETGYLPNEALSSRAATTETRDDHWMRGEVHDPRAALLGGIAGHAGLFSTGSDLALYANMLLSKGTAGNARIFSSATLAEMTRPRDIAGQLRCLGWDSRSKYSSNRGEFFSSQAFGHGGFTGTAFWIDPELDLFVIFLSNRVHPNGKGSVNPLAGRIATIASAAIRKNNPLHGTETTSTTKKKSSPALCGPVLCGIDVLERDEFKALTGRRVGLITNHTGVNRQGKPTIDLLHEAKDVDLVAIFSPEHGLRGILDQTNIDNTRDEATGLPVYSLYGETRHPEESQLEGIDTLVFDIQDIGTRFYTFISTMGLAMEAANKHGLRFVVLDRPNPISGTIVEGPLLDAGKESFVGHHTIPVRHGMTIGELAQLFRKERGWDLDLHVIKVKNWQRQDYWDATGLTWINPSPNMRCLTQALLYPGIGLLETTNLSVGRGTDTPFEVVGAPWINDLELAAALNDESLPGARFVPIRFTPEQSKFKGKQCGGVNVVVVDRNNFQSVSVGLTIAKTLRKLYPKDWEMTRFNRLLSNDHVFESVKSATSTEDLRGIVQSDAKKFQIRRKTNLIYP